MPDVYTKIFGYDTLVLVDNGDGTYRKAGTSGGGGGEGGATEATLISTMATLDATMQAILTRLNDNAVGLIDDGTTLPMAQNVNGIAQGNVLLQKKRTLISCSSVGNNVLIAGVEDKLIIITSLLIVTTADVGIKFISGTTDLSGVIPLKTAGAGFLLGHNPGGWLESDDVDEDFIVHTSGAATLTGFLNYVEAEPVA